MKKIKDWLDNYSKQLLIILVCVIIVSYAGVWLIQSGGGSTKYSGQNLYSLTQVAEMIQENNAAYGKNVEISFSTSDDAQIVIMTMMPKGASKDNPVPTVVACHGSNSQHMNYMRLAGELTRRGYGVVLFDGQGHGESTIDLGDYTHGTAGFEAALEYTMSLPWVDETNIGITGHSWGTRQVNAVVNYVNSNTSNHIKSALYMGSGQGLNMDPQESNIYLGAVAGVYDEHLNNMIGNGSYDLSSQRNARIQVDWIYPDFSEDVVDPEWLAGRGGTAPSTFGEDARVQIGYWYTPDGPVEFNPTELNVAPGSVIFFHPNVTHDGTIYNTGALSCVISYFQATLGSTPGGHAYLNSSNQIQQYAQIFSIIGYFALFLMLFPLINQVLKIDFFAKLKKADTNSESSVPAFKSASGQGRFWITNILTTGFGIISFFVLCNDTSGTASWFPSNANWPIQDANRYLIWMMAEGIFAILLHCTINGIEEYRAKKKGITCEGMLTSALKDTTFTDVFRSVLLAGLVMTVFWTLVQIGYRLFGATFLFSFDLTGQMPVYIFPYPFRRLLVLPRYLPFFALAWIPMSIGIVKSNYKDIPEWLQSLFCAIFNAFPLVFFLIYEYIGFATAKHNVTNYDVYWLGGMLRNFVYPMLILPVLSRYIYRKTNNVWVPACINTLFVALVSLATLISYYIMAIV